MGYSKESLSKSCRSMAERDGAFALEDCLQVLSHEEEADGLVRRMDDFGGYSCLGYPLAGRACSWEWPQCWLCRETNFVADGDQEGVAACSVLLPVELAPGNDLSAG